MELFVFAAVLVGAACHAGWNTAVKLRLDPLTAISGLAAAAGVAAIPLVIAFGIPAAPSWPYLAASVALHIVYNAALSEAYRAGDLGQVYPIARGAAPVMTALIGTLWLGETLGLSGWLGVVIITTGILLLSLRGGQALDSDRRAVGFALLTALSITAYSLADGLGGRLSGSPHAYTAWLFLIDGIVMAIYGSWRQGAQLLRAARVNWRVMLLGGILSIASYWIAIWAMTQAPIGLVAALRETSVVFGAFFAWLLLKEPLRAVRIASACLVALGAIFIRLH
ncbi:MAG: DMT family transporter [Hyphomicrobiaceae bacterium]